MKMLVRKLDPLCHDDVREDCEAIRAILNQHGYEASLIDIEWAYGELCEEYYAATWLELDFFKGEKMVEGIKRYLGEAPPPELGAEQVAPGTFVVGGNCDENGYYRDPQPGRDW